MREEIPGPEETRKRRNSTQRATKQSESCRAEGTPAQRGLTEEGLPQTGKSPEGGEQGPAF